MSAHRRRGRPRSWLIDMDGVLLYEELAVPAAGRFLARLHDLEVSFLVLTNNSIYTRRDLAARLRASGLDVTGSDARRLRRTDHAKR